MSVRPTVSVVMPVWRGDNPAFLRPAIDSVLTQSHEALELIVVQDGEIPAVLQEVLDSVAGSDERVGRIEHDGVHGPAAARNAGVAASAGEFVAFLDADDVMSPQRIERQLAYLEREALDVCGSCYRVIDDSGRVAGERRVPLDGASIRRFMGVMNPIGCSMVFARTAVLREHPYDEGIRYGEDYDLNNRLLRAGCVIANMPEYLTDVRAGAGFLGRRRGWEPFASDLRNRLRGTALAPVLWRPVIFAGAMGLVAARLMPRGVLRALYGVRARLRFGG